MQVDFLVILRLRYTINSCHYRNYIFCSSNNKKISRYANNLWKFM